MLERSMNLDPQPGGIMPELHLKKDTSYLRVKAMIPPDGITDFMYKPAIIRGVRPDGYELFDRAGCMFENRKISVTIYEGFIREMSAVPGRFKCTLTIVDKSGSVTKDNYMDFGTQTVLPFMVVVEK